MSSSKRNSERKGGLNGKRNIWNDFWNIWNLHSGFAIPWFRNHQSFTTFWNTIATNPRGLDS